MVNGRKILEEALINLYAEVVAYEAEHGPILEDLEVPHYLIEIDGKNYANPEYSKNFQLYELYKGKFSRIPEIKSRLEEDDPSPFFELDTDKGIYLLKITAPKLKSEIGLGGLIIRKEDTWISPRKDRLIPDDIIFGKSSVRS